MLMREEADLRKRITVWEEVTNREIYTGYMLLYVYVLLIV